MLTITENAAHLVRILMQKAGLAEDKSGLRIVIDADNDSLSMDLAEGAEATDSTVGDHGTHVFLSPPAAARLSERTLNAEVTETRSTFFLNR